MAVNCTLPVDQGGLDDVFYIDTEDTFRPERITQMARGHGLDPDYVLSRIHVARAYNSAHQMLPLDEIKRMSKGLNVKMIIVDSLTSHFRAEFIGRGMLARRQQKLNSHLKDLKKLADVNNALVLVTNQVHSKPDAMGDPTGPPLAATFSLTPAPSGSTSAIRGGRRPPPGRFTQLARRRVRVPETEEGLRDRFGQRTEGGKLLDEALLVAAHSNSVHGKSAQRAI